MKFDVRLNYCLSVEAISEREAILKVAELLKNEPTLAIRGVGHKKLPPLWKMLLLGC